MKGLKMQYTKEYTKDKIWNSCQEGKQVKTTYKGTKQVRTTFLLELLRINLFVSHDIISYRRWFI